MKNCESKTNIRESNSGAEIKGVNSVYARTDSSPELKSRLIQMKAATPVDEETAISFDLENLTSSEDELTSSDDENKISKSPASSPHTSKVNKTSPARHACASKQKSPRDGASPSRSPRASERTDSSERDSPNGDYFTFKTNDSPTNSPHASSQSDSLEKDYKVSLCKKGPNTFAVKAKISSSVESDKDLYDKSMKDSDSKTKSHNNSGVLDQTDILSSKLEKCQVTDEVDSCEGEGSDIDNEYETFDEDNLLSQKLSNVDYYHLTFEDD